MKRLANRWDPNPVARLQVLIGIIFAWLAWLAPLPGWAGPTADPARQPRKRALIIGIQRYTIAPEDTPVGVHPLTRATNLQAPVRDAESIAALLGWLGFAQQDIRILRNQEANRDGLLRALEQHLLEAARPGDLSVLYFAGHGSYLPGGDPGSIFGQDETLVPADANLGVPDITGGELVTLINRILDRNVRFVGIFDSCHSGTLARGAADGVRIREVPPMTIPAKSRSPHPAILPRTRGALVLSAAQPTEQAVEKTLFGHPSGIFTRALHDALIATRGRESAEDLLQRVSALMRTYGGSQTPDLDAMPQRRRQTLFGEPVRDAAPRLTAAVLKAEGPREIHLDIGQAAGIGEGAELGQAGKRGAALRITAVRGLMESTAEQLDNRAIRVGELFTVLKPGKRRLGIDTHFFIERAAPSTRELQAAATELAALAGDPRLRWVPDPITADYSHEIFWSAAQRAWMLRDLCQRSSVQLDPPLVAHALPILLAPRQPAPLRGPLPRECERSGQPALLVRLPPSPAVALAVTGAALWRERQLHATDDLSAADYALMGRIGADRQPEYAWVRPAVGPSQLSILSPRGRDWRRLSDSAGTQALIEDALALSRVKGWQTLATPAGSPPFGYDMMLRSMLLQSQSPKRELHPGAAIPVVYFGETYQLILKKIAASPVPSFVYIFNIDQYGQSTCVMPPDCISASRLPAAFPPPAEYSDGVQHLIKAPAGLDTLLLLATPNPLPHSQALFSFSGIEPLAKGALAAMDPLERMLYSLGDAARGEESLPADWSVSHFPRLTLPPPPPTLSSPLQTKAHAPP